MSVLEPELLSQGPEPPRRAPRRPGPRVLLGLVVVASLALAAVVVVSRSDDVDVSPQTDPVAAGYAAWRSGPARGDLAGDQTFTGAVLAAWAANPAPADRPEQAVLADRPLGPARVAWAGTVAGRPTAVVFQEAMVTQEEIPELDEGAGGPSDLWAYARADPDGTVRIVAVDLRISSRMPPAGVLGAWVDADRAVALLLDLGVPTQLSPAVTAGPAGFARSFVPLEFAAGGAAVVDLDESAPGPPLLSAVFVRSDVGPVPFYGLAGPLPTRGPVSEGDPLALDWAYGWDSDAATLVHVVGLASPESRRGDPYLSAFVATAERALRASPVDLQLQLTGSADWILAGKLASGEFLSVSALDVAGTPFVTYTLGVAQDGAFGVGGPLDASEPLPIAVRLADGHGWVVAAPQTALRYRLSADREWQDVGFEAALLPDADHLEVEITRAGVAQVVVLDG